LPAKRRIYCNRALNMKQIKVSEQGEGGEVFKGNMKQSSAKKQGFKLGING